jgi:hypothetical protein
MRTENGRSQTRRVALVTKEYEGTFYALGVFSHPDDLRGTAFLTIENGEGTDYFLYLPAFLRVKRVSAYQKSDPWFGTDLSIEDVERRTLSDYQIIGSRRVADADEPAHEITTRPLYGSRYDRVHFVIADRDHATLRAEYYRSGHEVISKLIQADREGLVERNGAIVPRRLLCSNLESQTRTEVVVDDVIFSPDVEKELFTVGSLEQRARLRLLE